MLVYNVPSTVSYSAMNVQYFLTSIVSSSKGSTNVSPFCKHIVAVCKH